MTAPFEFNGVVRLTRIGTTYILGTIVLAIAALNTGNNAIYIGVAFMLACLLLSGLASKGGLKHLQVEIGAIDEAWAGRPADAGETPELRGAMLRPHESKNRRHSRGWDRSRGHA